MAMTSAAVLEMPGAASTAGFAWGGLNLSEVRFRNIRAEDFERLHAFVHGLSPETGYKRLLSPRMPTDDELRRWSDIDPATECAIVAVTGSEDQEKLVGVARFVVESPQEADFAIVLADAWQGLGLGGELLSRLISAARRRGLRKLRGDALATNTRMVALAGRLGFARLRSSGFVTTLSLDLAS
jgi:acetyltransferase